MRELNTKRSCQECLFAVVRYLVTITEITNVRSGSDPSRASKGRFPYRIQYRFHTVIKLRIRFLTINYIECIRSHIVHIWNLKNKHFFKNYLPQRCPTFLTTPCIHIYKVSTRTRNEYRTFIGPIQTETFQNKIFYKKVSGCVSLSRQGADLGDSKICHFWKNYNVPEWENRFTSGLNFAKITDHIQTKRTSIFPRRGAMGLPQKWS